MMKIVKGSSFFSRTLRSYAAILAVPIFIFCIFLYHQIYASDRRAVRADCLACAAKTAERLNGKMVNANDMGNQFLTSDWLQRANSDMADEYFGPLEKANIVRELAACKSISGIFSDMSVFLAGKNTVISQSGWWDMQSYFLHCGIDGTEQQNAFLRMMNETNYTELVNLRSQHIDVSGSDNLVLIQTLDTVTYPRAFFVLTFDSQKLNSYLSSDDSRLLRVAIRQNGAELYSYQAGDYRKYGKNSFSVSVPSKVYLWTYDIVLRYDRFPRLFSDFTILLAAILLSIIFGTVAAYVLALVSYKPLKGLMARIGITGGSAGENTHEYAAIEKTFGTMADEKKKLERTVQQYKSITRGNLIANLLKGYFDTEKIQPQLEQYSIPYDDSRYYMVVLCDCGGAGQEARSALDVYICLKAGLQTQGVSFEMLEIPDDCIGIIFSSRAPRTEKDIRDLTENVSRHAGLPLPFYFGTVERGLIGISKSYQFAKEACISAAFQTLRMREAAVTLQNDHCFYPTDWEFQIVNQLKVGNIPLIHKIIGELRAENEKRQLTEEECVKLRSMIFQTIIRVMNELNMEIRKPMQQFQRIVRLGSADKQWTYIEKLTDGVCSRAAYASKPVGQSTGSRILAYVQANYMDPTLSLKALSNIFQLSDSAISKIFKDTERINFYEYLCRIRMEKAKEYFADRTVRIADVALMVGYENVLSFKRAFLRYEGVNPKEYMLQHTGKVPG